MSPSLTSSPNGTATTARGATRTRDRRVSDRIAYTVYLSAQFTAGGLIFRTLLGLPETLGMFVMVITALTYIAFGGMRASALTDFVQAVVMAVGVVVALPLILQFIGGFAAINAVFQSYNPSFVGMALSTQEIVGFMAAFGFSIASAPYEITRIYSMKNEKVVPQVIGITLIFQATIGTTVALLGVTMKVLFPQLSTSDLASVVMSINVLGPILGALLITTVFAAILSTVDSIMIASGAGLAHDIYAEMLNPNATERQKVWANHISVVILELIPFGLALNAGLLGDLVQFIVILQASMMGGMFFVPLVLGLHWKRANTLGGITGMVAGFFTVVIWHIGTEIYSFICLVAAVAESVLSCFLACFREICGDLDALLRYEVETTARTTV